MTILQRLAEKEKMELSSSIDAQQGLKEADLANASRNGSSSLSNVDGQSSGSQNASFDEQLDKESQTSESIKNKESSIVGEQADSDLETSDVSSSSDIELNKLEDKAEIVDVEEASQTKAELPPQSSGFTDSGEETTDVLTFKEHAQDLKTASDMDDDSLDARGVLDQIYNETELVEPSTSELEAKKDETSDEVNSQKHSPTFDTADPESEVSSQPKSQTSKPQEKESPQAETDDASLIKEEKQADDLLTKEQEQTVSTEPSVEKSNQTYKASNLPNDVQDTEAYPNMYGQVHNLSPVSCLLNSHCSSWFISSVCLVLVSRVLLIDDQPLAVITTWQSRTLMNNNEGSQRTILQTTSVPAVVLSAYSLVLSQFETYIIKKNTGSSFTDTSTYQCALTCHGRLSSFLASQEQTMQTETIMKTTLDWTCLTFLRVFYDFSWVLGKVLAAKYLILHCLFLSLICTSAIIMETCQSKHCSCDGIKSVLKGQTIAKH